MFARMFKTFVLLLSLMTMAHATPDQSHGMNNVLNNKFKFLTIPLNDNIRANIIKSAQALSQKRTFSNTLNRESSVELGMNNTPVLNQQQYGSCATFAVTAAIDALAGAGDYYSQLCLLELGNYLSEKSYVRSGWAGDLVDDVLYKITFFGLISKANQSTYGCGGVYTYPHDGKEPNSFMDINDYKQLSENIREHVSFYPVEVAKRFNGEEQQANKKLANAKEALKNGHRVVFGVLLQNFNNVMGLTKHMNKYDTWLISKNIKDNIEQGQIDTTHGHAMIITGYNDSLEIIDEQGTPHRGFFTLRNSWGEKPFEDNDDIGNHGDYYMSYEYFKLLSFEAYALY